MDIHNKTVNKYYKNYKWYEVKELKFNLYGLFPYFKTIRKIFNNTFAELNKYKKNNIFISKLFLSYHTFNSLVKPINYNSHKLYDNKICKEYIKETNTSILKLDNKGIVKINYDDNDNIYNSNICEQITLYINTEEYIYDDITDLTENEQIEYSNYMNKLNNMIEEYNEMYEWFKNKFLNYIVLDNNQLNCKNVHLSWECETRENKKQNKCYITDYINVIKNYKNNKKEIQEYFIKLINSEVKKEIEIKDLNDADLSVYFILIIIHNLFKNYDFMLNYCKTILNEKPQCIRQKKDLLVSLDENYFQFNNNNKELHIKHMNMIANSICYKKNVEKMEYASHIVLSLIVQRPNIYFDTI